MKDFKKLFNSDLNMLDVIFTARAEELSELIQKDIDAINTVARQTNEECECLKEYLNKIPNEYQEIKKKILEVFDNYTNVLEYREGYFNEKYYKAGIRDGINILINCFVRS